MPLTKLKLDVSRTDHSTDLELDDKVMVRPFLHPESRLVLLLAFLQADGSKRRLDTAYLLYI